MRLRFLLAVCATSSALMAHSSGHRTSIHRQQEYFQAVTVYLPETEGPVCVFYMDSRDCPFRDEGQLLRKLVDAKAQHRQASVLFYNPEAQ